MPTRVEQRRDRADQHHHRGGAEHHHQDGVERLEELLDRIVAKDAADRLPTGGRFDTSCATVADTPCCSPALIALGSVFASPMIINEKKVAVTVQANRC